MPSNASSTSKPQRAVARATSDPSRRREKPTPPPEAICTIVHQDEHLVVVDKRPGFPVSPNAIYRSRSVLHTLQRLGLGVCYPVSLLDREATGLVLLSRTVETARSLRWNWRSSLCERQFIAVAQGDVPGAHGRITLPIGQVEAGHTRRRGVLLPEAGGRAAETRWKLLARGRGMSRLLITLHHTRCHQIRIHLAAIGFPLVNESVYIERNREMPIDALLEGAERKYEISKLPAHQVGLHLWRVTIAHPVSGEIVNFEAPIPRELLNLMPNAWVVNEI